MNISSECCTTSNYRWQSLDLTGRNEGDLLKGAIVLGSRPVARPADTLPPFSPRKYSYDGSLDNSCFGVIGGIPKGSKCNCHDCVPSLRWAYRSAIDENNRLAEAYVELDRKHKLDQLSFYEKNRSLLAHPLYVARVHHDGGWIAAELDENHTFSFVAGGLRRTTSIGEVLVAQNPCEPVWLHSGWGDKVKGAMMLNNTEEQSDMIGRVFSGERWVIGSVSTKLGLIKYLKTSAANFGMQKSATGQEYQVLMQGLSWQDVREEPAAPRRLETLDSCKPTAKNSIKYAPLQLQMDRCGHQRVDPSNHCLTSQATDVTFWVPSGGGKDVANAVMVHQYQCGRARAEDGTWVCGWVQPASASKPGLHDEGGNHYMAYEVLAANHSWLPAGPMGTVTIGKEAESDSRNLPKEQDHDKAGELISAEELYLMTKVKKGESVKTAREEMLTEAKAAKLLGAVSGVGS